MSPTRWSRLREVFEGALEQTPEAVEDFLRAECGEDPDLYAEVRRMLSAHAATGPLDHEVLPPAPKSGASAGRMGTSGPVFSAGQIIAGRYRIIRYLSRGGMGEVYEAEHLELLGERVALKTLLPDIASDARMIARFKREIQLSRKITHPNVCRVFDLERHPPDGQPSDATYFFTMTFLEGENLSARLTRQGRMSPAEALPLLDQMAGALDAAHEAGVSHRDFKPSNVMLVPSSGGTRAVVTDFGLARRVAGSDDRTATLSGQVMGTLDYMAPELLTGAQESVQSDIYALAMTAYKMIAGTLPFDSTTPWGAAILRSKQPVPSPRKAVPDLNPRWDRALVRGLDPNPAQRFGRAREFVGALRGETASVTLKLPPMTRRKAAGAVVAALLLTGVLVAWTGWMRWRNRPSPEATLLYKTGVDDLHAGAYFAASKALTQAVKLAPAFSLGHARLAEAWLEMEMPEKASQEMLLARRQETAGLSQRDRFEIEAVDLTITRDFAAAVDKYERLQSMGGSDPAGMDVDLGRAYEKATNPGKAMAAYRRAAESPSHNPAAWLRLGVLYSQRSEPAKAEQAFQSAELQYQNTSNLEGITEVEVQRGVAANRQLRLAEGAAHLQKALETARLAGNLQQEIRAKMQLGTNAVLAGDADKAEQYSREALDTAEANQMQSQAVRGMFGMGSASLRKRDFANADRYYQNALSLARTGGEQHLVALALLSLASMHDQMNSPAAEREAMEAFAFYHANGFVKEELQCLTLAGRAQRKQGDFTRALSSFQQLLDAATKANDRQQIAVAHESLGALFAAQERFPEALAEYQKNLDAINDPERLVWTQLQSGAELWRLGRYAEAERSFDVAARDGQKYAALRAALAVERAEMALSQEKFSAAGAAARQALASNSGPEVVQLKAILGLALVSSGQRREGLKECEESVAAARALSDQYRLIASELALLRARVENGDAAGARAQLDQLTPVLPNHPESRWRALALMGRLDAAYKADAVKAAEDLKHGWGDAAFLAYERRPDIARLLRPLMPQTLR